MTSAAPVNRILRSSIVDGPGNRAVVFVQGCNFDCVYCHNPETIRLCCSCGDCVAVCPVYALSLQEGAVVWRPERCTRCDACLKVCVHHSSPRVRVLSAEAVMAEIEPALPFIRGITVSGGECTLYPDFLQTLGELAKAQGKSFFLDTNGSYDFSEDPRLLEVTDGIMLDIKAAPDSPDSKQIIRRLDYPILAAAEFLAQSGKLYEVRTVISPGLFDAAALTDLVCRSIARFDPRPQYKLIRYRPLGVRPEAAAVLRVPEEALMEQLAACCTGYGISVSAV